MPLIKQRGFKGLNSSILCDVFLLISLLLSKVHAQSIEIVPSVFNEDDLVLKPLPPPNDTSVSEPSRFEIAKRFDTFSEFSKSSHDTIHRILRDEDPSFRNDDQRTTIRWKKSASSPMHRKVSKREIESFLPFNNSRSSENSTKSLDLVNSNLTKFVIDSDLELQFKQSDDRQTITRLNLTSNLISEFRSKDLSPYLAGVKDLDLSYNRLTKFVLNANSQLVTVNLSANNLTHFVVDGIDSQLTALTIQNNNLSLEKLASTKSQFDLTPIANLETLDLSCNEINSIDAKLIGRGRSLRRLNLSRNRLKRIPKNVFYNLENIDTLLLSYNQIEHIDPETFSVLPTLQYLDLSYNKIGTESIRSLQGIPDLVGLSMAYNPDLGDALQEFVASWSLKELDASGTGLCRIPSALAQSVRTLVLIDNWFQIIRCGDLDSYPLLQYLDLSNSHIIEIEDDALGRLEILQTLFLDHNSLKRIPVSLPTSLENLFLNNNDITDIQPQSLQQLSNLRTLDLSHNKLTYIPGLPLPKLLVLNLQSSEVRGLSQSVVKTSPKLRDLLLDGNPIKCTELMGIAEWASPCQNRDGIAKRSVQFVDEKTNQQGIKRAFIEMHDYLTGFPSVWQECPGNNNSPTSEYTKRPQCANSKDDSMSLSNKLETQFDRITVNGSKTIPSAISSFNQSNEDVENSIRDSRLQVDMHSEISTNEIRRANRKDSGEIDANSHISSLVANDLAGSQRSSFYLVQNNSTLQIDERPINISRDNGRINATKTNGNQRKNNKITGRKLKSAKSSILSPTELLLASLSTSYSPPEISKSQLHHSSVRSDVKLSKKNIRQKQQLPLNSRYEFDSNPRKIKLDKGNVATTSRPHGVSTPKLETKSHSPLNTSKQIRTRYHFTKSTQVATTPTPAAYTSSTSDTQVQQVTAAIASINATRSDETKTTQQAKTMMSSIQPTDYDSTRNSMRKLSRTTASTKQQNISTNKIINNTAASDFTNLTSGTTPHPAIVGTTVTTKTALNLEWIGSKILSSKVNKADKVVDGQQQQHLSPSAINDNGIIKRNQNSSSYLGHNRTAEGVGILARRPQNSEHIIVSHTTQSTSPLQAASNGNQQQYQDVSQQNRKTTVTGAPHVSAVAGTPGGFLSKKALHPLDKVKDDKHLRFVGAKNLNLTVLTYNGKSHVHKTINKDIAPHPRHSPATTLSPSEQLRFELGIGSERSSTIDFQSTTISPASYTGNGAHVRVNKKRVANESNNHENNSHHEDRLGEGDSHPRLNALHALASQHLNSTLNSSDSHTGLPPERWLDIRTATGHPGLFVVIGLTIGVVFTLGLIHIYRCRRPAAWPRTSHLHHLHDRLHSPHCCNNNGPEAGSTGNMHEYSPGHFCSHSYNNTDDDAGYYIEPEHNRVRSSARRDFLPMELLSGNSCRDTKNASNNGRHHFPESHVHSIW